MMDTKSQEEFDRITSIPDLEALTPEEINFLKARRAYLNPSQRLAYKELNLFEKNEKSQSVEVNLPNANDLPEEELKALEQNKVPQSPKK